ncbi:MAG: PQQ-binding-like beta-propeller repeat protein [Planctomycetes bacterium]|nr:PQQ-binding-like beta-propeller repeat protein [Planctomycetota bacterium]
MNRRTIVSCLTLLCIVASCSTTEESWTQFRGPGGLGTSEGRRVPEQWGRDYHVVWRTKLPGPGTASPIFLGNRIYVTAYSGYGLKPSEGDVNQLMRHLVCINRMSGEIRWSKPFVPVQPESPYEGEGSYHGYSSSTPTTDGKRLYVFFGKSGVFCFDLNGKQLWRREVGDGTRLWGSAASPILHDDLLIVNASVESGTIYAFDKMTGEEVWQAKDIGEAWNTPLLIDLPRGTELVVAVQGHMLGFDATTGKKLWNADGIHRYVCPSPIAHDDIVYAIGGGHTSLAVRAGGLGDVTESRVLWREQGGSNVSSPVYHDGYLYWASDHRGIVYCQNAETGEYAYKSRLTPPSGKFYASPVLVDDRIYYVSQHNGTYVVAAKPEFELLAHNVITDDDSRTNASPVVMDGRLLLRSDRYLYCIGRRQ